jgi:tripartite-type tricarboxylate transporter receptor subunit TctC
VYPKIAYDAKRDFAPVAMVGYLPLALIVNPNVKAADLKQYIALAKANPGKMTFASYGLGSSSQVAMEMLNQKEGLSLLHVPFQGAAPAVTAVMAGQVDAMMVPLTVAWPNHQAGKVRVLGVAAPKRFVGVPEVATFAEQGVDLVSAPWIGILAPAKTPADMIDRLSRDTVAVVEDPAIQETLVKNGLQPDARKASDFKTLLDAEYERWGAAVKAANIKSE